MHMADLAETVVIKHFGLHQSVATIADELLVSKSYCYRVLGRWDKGEPVAGKRATSSVSPPLTLAARDKLADLLNLTETAYLDELADQLERSTGAEASLFSICQALKEDGLTREQARETRRAAATVAQLWCLHLPMRRVAYLCEGIRVSAVARFGGARNREPQGQF